MTFYEWQEKIADIRKDLLKTDDSPMDKRAKALVVTKLEEAELWCSKLETPVGM